jgi:hypothetical protein
MGRDAFDFRIVMLAARPDCVNRGGVVGHDRSTVDDVRMREARRL